MALPEPRRDVFCMHVAAGDKLGLADFSYGDSGFGVSTVYQPVFAYSALAARRACCPGRFSAALVGVLIVQQGDIQHTRNGRSFAQYITALDGHRRHKTVRYLVWRGRGGGGKNSMTGGEIPRQCIAWCVKSTSGRVQKQMGNWQRLVQLIYSHVSIRSPPASLEPQSNGQRRRMLAWAAANVTRRRAAKRSPSDAG